MGAFDEIHRVIVVSDSDSLTQTPTISNAVAYTSGDAIGGKLTFDSATRIHGGSGIIVNTVITDLDKQDAEIDLFLFDRDFTATADNDPFDIADGELSTLVGVIKVSEYFDAADNSVGQNKIDRLEYKVRDNTSTLYGQMVIRAAKTYASTSSLTVKLNVSRN